MHSIPIPLDLLYILRRFSLITPKDWILTYCTSDKPRSRTRILSSSHPIFNSFGPISKSCRQRDRNHQRSPSRRNENSFPTSDITSLKNGQHTPISAILILCRNHGPIVPGIVVLVSALFNSQTILLSPAAFYERDPVDVALDWYDADGNNIPVIMPANEKRPGGDWEAGVMSPEECLCRRSTLYGTLTTPGPESGASSHYPIPPKAGIFSEKVGMYHHISRSRDHN